MVSSFLINRNTNETPIGDSKFITSLGHSANLTLNPRPLFTPQPDSASRTPNSVAREEQNDYELDLSEANKNPQKSILQSVSSLKEDADISEISKLQTMLWESQQSLLVAGVTTPSDSITNSEMTKVTLNRNVEVLEQQMRILQDQNLQLEKDGKRMRDQWSSQCTTLQARNNQLIRKQERAVEVQSSYEERLMAQEIDIGSLQRKEKALQAEIRDIKEQHDSKCEQLVSLQKEQVSRNSKCKQLQHRVNSLENEIKVMAHTSKALSTVLHRCMAEFACDFDFFNNKIQEAGDGHELETIAECMQISLRESKSFCDSLQKDLEASQTTSEDRRLHILRLEAKLIREQKARCEEKARTQGLLVEMEVSKTTVDELMAKVTSCRTVESALAQENKNISQEKTQLALELQDVLEKLQSLLVDQEKLCQEIATLERSLENERSLRNAAVRDSKMLGDQVNSLQAELSGTKDGIVASKVRFSQGETKLRNSIKTLESKLREKEKEAKSIQRESIKEKKRLEGEMQDTMRELETCREKLVKLQEINLVIKFHLFLRVGTFRIVKETNRCN